MQAFILAGGLGTRLRTIVNGTPKPMASVGDGAAGHGKPFLEYQLEFLRGWGIVDFVFCVGYLHEHIQAYFGDGSRWGVKIDYSIEEERLGTGGALKLAQKYTRGAFLALNGDSFFDVNLDKLISFHTGHKTTAQQGDYLGTIALTRVQDARNYGLVKLNRENNIVNFNEKKAAGAAELNGSNLINAGIYVLEAEILNLIPPFKKVSIEKEVFPSVLNNGHYLGGYPAEGFFVDIGTPAGYHQFQNYLREKNL